jgi:hypothetical protein
VISSSAAAQRSLHEALLQMSLVVDGSAEGQIWLEVAGVGELSVRQSGCAEGGRTVASLHLRTERSDTAGDHAQ